MLYAIGGVPRAGKTELAKRIHRERGISVLTTDAIVTTFMAVAPELEINYGHPDRRKKVAPGLKAAVRQIMNNNDDYLIEGELLDPWMVEELRSVTSVRSCFLTMSKPELSSIIENEKSNAWVVDMTDEEQATLLLALQEFNDHVVSQCESFGEPFFDVSSGGYESVIDAARQHLLREPDVHPA